MVEIVVSQPHPETLKVCTGAGGQVETEESSEAVVAARAGGRAVRGLQVSAVLCNMRVSMSSKPQATVYVLPPRLLRVVSQ